MGRRISIISAVVVLTVLGCTAVASPAAALARRTILVTTTIQAAVDAAEPGDTILVPRGPTASVLVTKPPDHRWQPRRSWMRRGSGLASGSGPGGSRGTGQNPPCPPLAIQGSRCRNDDHPPASAACSWSTWTAITSSALAI